MPARSAGSSGGSATTARKPQWQKAARNRLPPVTARRPAATSRDASSPSASRRTPCSSTNSSRADWTSARKASASQLEVTVASLRSAVARMDTPGGHRRGALILLRMALGTSSTSPAGRSPRVGDLIAAGERSISFEFFPPRDEEGERQLWTALRQLEALQPTFVSVTYGAGGSTRDRTIRVTEGIAQETTLTPMAHLTCVGHSRAELRRVIGSYANAGVRNVLALRGDPPAGPSAPFEPHPRGLNNAVELVELTRGLGDFCVGVAAFPEVHPAAESADSDARYLAAKARAGAEFAITQLFFRPSDYFALWTAWPRSASTSRSSPASCRSRTSPRSRGWPSSPARTCRTRSWSASPASTVTRPSVRAEGIAIATEMCDALLAGGAPGLHFYTLNRSKATREIYAGLRSTVG